MKNSMLMTFRNRSMKDETSVVRFEKKERKKKTKEKRKKTFFL